ncbi:MAG: CvpA family protein [Anaerolineae bacterium]
MNVLGLNAFDLLLLVVVIVGALIGFVRGVVPQLISLVSIWIGLIATLWLYQTLSNQILQPETSGFGMSKTPADTLAFLILLIVFFNAFRLVVKYLAVPPEERRKKRKKKFQMTRWLMRCALSAMQRFVYWANQRRWWNYLRALY